MVQIVGAYKLERNEELNEFYQAMGVPWMARKMMCSSTPTIYVTQGDEEDTWVFKTVTFFRTIEISFKLNEDYKETMPSGNTYDSLTTKEGDNLFVTKSKQEDLDEVDFVRRYEFNDDGMIMIMKSQKTKVVAKRYFKRISSE